MSPKKARAGTFDELRRRAGELLEQRSTNGSSLESTDIAELIHELEVHQAELEIQTEDLRRSQQELIALNKDYEELYEFAPCGYLTLNAGGLITRANLTAVSLLGIERSFLYNSTFSAFILPGWQYAYLTIRQRVGETGEKQSIELPLKQNTGSTLWVKASIQADGNEAGDWRKWYIVLDDITERKLTEEALQKSRERYFKIFHKSPSFMLMTVFEDGTIVDVNDAYCQLTGYARQELMGSTAVELGIIDPEDRLEGNRLLQENGSFQNKEERRWTSTGQERHVLLSAETINLEGQRYIISMGLDITERKLAEDALRQNRNLLAEAENMADVGAWSWDIQNDVWSFSENWLKIHGCSEPPRTTDDLLPIAHPEDQIKIREAFRNSLAEKARYDIEHRIVRQDTGEIRHIKGFGDVETNSAGDPARMFGAAMDVTRQRRDQQALEQAREAAERANRAKSDFLALMSHEIRTPMNSILGMLRLSLTGDLPGKQKERIQIARESAESLLRLLNDLLDLSRVEAGGFTLHEKEFRIRHLLNNVCPEIEVQASEKNIKHYLSVGQDLPTVLHGDPYRLKRILFNLLFNAIKFTDQGWVSLEVEQVDITPGPEDDGFMITMVLFKVKDTGKGIDPDHMESIFDSYNQAVHDSLSPEQGTGLGLAICKNLSEQMGGSIWAESQPGQGSIFYVQLPFKTDGQIIEEPEAVSDEVNWPDSSPLNILLVEDQKMNQIFTMDLLSSYGHQVTVAENGQEALDKLGKTSFDLVLMDIRMPVMDGIETTMRIRTADPLIMNTDIPVIGLSAHTVTNQEMQRFEYAGFNHYVVKPVSFEKLFTAIEEVLKKDQKE